jgi:hypothetical protein
MFLLHRKQIYGHPRPVTRDSFTFFYADNVRTSQEAQSSTACYGDSFSFFYVDNVRTSQEAQASTACYGDSFSFFYVDNIRTSQEAKEPQASIAY